MQRSRRGGINRFVKRFMMTILAVMFMAAGVAGFFMFTMSGNEWLEQLLSYGNELSFRAEGLDLRFEQWTDSLETRFEQMIPETVRPFFD
ncbi:hypothetical protein [Exiguobacterium sp.]|uniref:hypothetical protein n=1 Tax=Exiguobacterium sp. TaxID=44751 RepID=UPI00263B79C4|nr:hypothetical protein [Exiguobacterium sp.]MCC5891147.1 hypothetical protein [Exiguobacterium sp.]